MKAGGALAALHAVVRASLERHVILCKIVVWTSISKLVCQTTTTIASCHIWRTPFLMPLGSALQGVLGLGVGKAAELSQSVQKAYAQVMQGSSFMHGMTDFSLLM